MLVAEPAFPSAAFALMTQIPCSLLLEGFKSTRPIGEGFRHGSTSDGWTSEMDLNEIVENFELLDDWDDRYRYLIELGRELEPLDAMARTDANKVRGCASQVWVESTVHRDGEPRITLKGDSDAHIVRGLIALVFALYSGKASREIIDTQVQPLFEKLGLAAHLTPQRSNGVRAMVERIKSDARASMASH